MVELSRRERLLLDTLSQHTTVKDASHFLIYQKGKDDMTTAACYGILDRIRRRHTESRKYINTILAYRKKSPLLKKVLTIRTSKEE